MFVLIAALVSKDNNQKKKKAPEPALNRYKPGDHHRSPKSTSGEREPDIFIASDETSSRYLNKSRNTINHIQVHHMRPNLYFIKA